MFNRSSIPFSGMAEKKSIQHLPSYVVILIFTSKFIFFKVQIKTEDLNKEPNVATKK